MLKKVEGLRHKHFGGALPAEGFARAGVELPGNCIKLGLSKSGKVNALGEILAEQPVGVLVDTALRRTFHLMLFRSSTRVWSAASIRMRAKRGNSRSRITYEVIDIVAATISMYSQLRTLVAHMT